jgi:putative ABC transport system ATP-binding protein
MSILLGLNERQGATLIFVTHDPAIASRTQRIVRLRDGLIDSDG